MQPLAEYVPAGLLDARDGGHANDAKAPERLPVHLLVEMFDAGGILAENQGNEVLHGSHDAASFPFERGLAPAVEAVLIGFHSHEDPVAHLRVDDNCLEAGDFHLLW